MTSRNLPAIKRVRQTRYLASDGQAFDSHIAAFKHETFIALAAFIEERLLRYPAASTKDLARALLAAPDFRIVLLGPQTGVRPASQGPAGPPQSTPQSREGGAP